MSEWGEGEEIYGVFGRHPKSPGRARAALRGWAALRGLPEEATEIAALLLTELVTNACRHAESAAGWQIYVRCATVRGRLRVEVSDADATLPKPRDAGDDEESGRGLALVAALAAEWAAEPRTDAVGKTIWFELELPPGVAGVAVAAAS
jgi:anti-sigma regulatory factor (Ser/Thr protein kinase)